MKNSPRYSAAEALADLDLSDRLASAMRKAGVDGDVRLTEASVSQDYYDVSGIGIEASTPELTDRAVAWVKEALVRAGVKQWHTGAWQGPCVMGDPEVLRTTSYGKPVVMVTLNVYSIGD